MSIRDMILPGDETAIGLIRDWDRANQAAADIVNNDGEQIQFVDVQIGYRLKHSDVYLREEPITQVSPGALAAITTLAMHLHSQYSTLCVQAMASGNATRYVSVRTHDILFVNIATKPHVPEQNDEDVRRSKFRDAS